MKNTVAPESKTVEMGNAMNNESMLRTPSTPYNETTFLKQQIHEEYNSAYNHRPILELIAAERARDVHDEPKKGGQPVFIIGSGPSLDDSIEHLKDWEGGIVCSSSHALTLMYHGIEPDYIVMLDPFSSLEEIRGVDWSRTKTELIVHPGVWPDVIPSWPNEVLLFRQNLGRADSFYATTQKHMYTIREGSRDKAEFKLLIRTEVTVFACSPPAQLFLADRLGYGTSFLAGVDFAYHSGKERFTSYTVKEAERVIVSGNSAPTVIPAAWEKHEHPFVEPGPNDTFDPNAQNAPFRTKNGLWSARVHLFYKKNMISAWRLSGKDVYTTDHGAITEMPYMDIGKVVRSQGRKAKPRSVKWIHKQADRYLASVGAFVIENEPDAKGEIGYNFVESDTPETELRNWMLAMRGQYVCPACGIVVAANDQKEHEGDECPRCKEGKLGHRHDIDVAKNMLRIQELLKWVRENDPAPAAPEPLA